VKRAASNTQQAEGLAAQILAHLDELLVVPGSANLAMYLVRGAQKRDPQGLETPALDSLRSQLPQMKAMQDALSDPRRAASIYSSNSKSGSGAVANGPSYSATDMPSEHSEAPYYVR